MAAVLLGNRLMVFVGGISYSLYLVHWPIIVFYITVFGQLTAVSTVGLLVLMFALGYALNVTVENRFRHAQSREARFSYFRIFARGGMFGALVFSVLVVVSFKHIEGRVPEQRATMSNAEWRKLERQQYCKDKMEGFPESVFTCQNDRGSDRTIVVWGDSHGLHLVAGLSDVYPDDNIAVAYLSGCISQSGFNGYVRKFPSQKLTDQCVERNKAFLRWAETYGGNVIVYISNAKRNAPERIASINNQHVSMLEKYGHPAYVLGDFIRPGVELAQCYSVPEYLMTNSFLRSRCKVNSKAVARELRYGERLAELSRNYIPVQNIQCSAGVCSFDDGSGRVSFRDTHHLSPLGSMYWLRRLKEAGLI